MLSPDIMAVGFFVDESLDRVASALDAGIIDMAQLHGSEDESYIKELKERTEKPTPDKKTKTSLADARFTRKEDPQNENL